MGKESRSRRKRAQERQSPAPPTTDAAADSSPRDAGPERLLAKYGAEPIADLPTEARKFHLRVITDLLDSHDRAARPLGPLWATQTWHKHHDGLAAARPAELDFGDDKLRLACAPGCNHCCRTPVGVVAAEAVLLAQFIARTFSPQARRELDQRMTAHKAARRDDPRGNHLCPLNVGGNCQVYEFRPYNCRLFHSFDVAACERLLIDRQAHTLIPIDRVRKQYDGLIVASANVALNALKLDTRMLELTAALELALNAGDNRCERFGAGEDLFADLPTVTPDSPPPA